MAGFADLNVPQGADRKAVQSLLETAAHLGYSAVALNHIVDFKEKKQEIAKPVSPSELFPSLPIVQGTSKRLKVLTRLTLVVSDPSHCNLLRSTSTNIRLYDIIAVFPKTEKLFHIACTTLDVDLVCINVTEKLPFYFRRPPVNMAIDRGIYFELLYTPAIKDSTMRRYTISNAISLMQICKGKNIVISSAAEREFRCVFPPPRLQVTEVCCLACQKAKPRQLCPPTAEPPYFMEKLGRVPVG
ncbi:ribonuclease P protein subunit p30 isoform X2 [Meleagris gallopavo]|uniref:ribonuclease P protein subunit p30 isoform X2 n=1 Tax=Meleagris gallopavo TaxID=9103 RepID=UPI0012AC18D3|nr:ribonuclease P protein subunit p30 isoform X2 [Meleagris gallopavo]